MSRETELTEADSYLFNNATGGTPDAPALTAFKSTFGGDESVLSETALAKFNEWLKQNVQQLAASPQIYAQTVSDASWQAINAISDPDTDPDPTKDKRSIAWHQIEKAFENLSDATTDPTRKRAYGQVVQLMKVRDSTIDILHSLDEVATLPFSSPYPYNQDPNNADNTKQAFKDKLSPIVPDPMPAPAYAAFAGVIQDRNNDMTTNEATVKSILRATEAAVNAATTPADKAKALDHIQAAFQVIVQDPHHTQTDQLTVNALAQYRQRHDAQPALAHQNIDQIYTQAFTDLNRAELDIGANAYSDLIRIDRTNPNDGDLAANGTVLGANSLLAKMQDVAEGKRVSVDSDPLFLPDSGLHVSLSARPAEGTNGRPYYFLTIAQDPTPKEVMDPVHNKVTFGFPTTPGLNDPHSPLRLALDELNNKGIKAFEDYLGTHANITSRDIMLPAPVAITVAGRFKNPPSDLTIKDPNSTSTVTIAGLRTTVDSHGNEVATAIGTDGSPVKVPNVGSPLGGARDLRSTSTTRVDDAAAGAPATSVSGKTTFVFPGHDEAGHDVSVTVDNPVVAKLTATQTQLPGVRPRDAALPPIVPAQPGSYGRPDINSQTAYASIVNSPQYQQLMPPQGGIPASTPGVRPTEVYAIKEIPRSPQQMTAKEPKSVAAGAMIDPKDGQLHYAISLGYDNGKAERYFFDDAHAFQQALNYLSYPPPALETYLHSSISGSQAQAARMHFDTSMPPLHAGEPIPLGVAAPAQGPPPTQTVPPQAPIQREPLPPPQAQPTAAPAPPAFPTPPIHQTDANRPPARREDAVWHHAPGEGPTVVPVATGAAAAQQPLVATAARYPNYKGKLGDDMASAHPDQLAELAAENIERLHNGNLPTAYNVYGKELKAGKDAQVGSSAPSTKSRPKAWT